MIRKLASIFTQSHQSFQGQEAGEKVVLILRRHLFTVSYRLTLVFLAAFIPLLARLAFSSELSRGAAADVFLFASSLWYAFLWLAGFYILTLYSLNTVIITDRRIIENEQLGFFNRKVSELHIYRVQDVSVHTEGFMETMLSFGDVMVQTAASEREFIFKNVPYPEKVKNAIMQCVSSHRTDLKLA